MANYLIKVNKNAMIFCRVVFAIILWIAFFLKFEWLVILSMFLMLFNVLLTLQFAPLIILYNKFLSRFEKKRKTELINIALIQIIHFIVFLVHLVAFVFIHFFNLKIGFIIIFFLALSKTIGALGFCPISKITNCAVSGCSS